MLGRVSTGIAPQRALFLVLLHGESLLLIEYVGAAVLEAVSVWVWFV